MRRARFTELARSEFLAEIAYYETIRQGLGAKFRAEVEATTERAAAFPDSGAPVAGDARRRLLPTFPFAVVYVETEYGILIHAVAHHRRLPESWKGRLNEPIPAYG